MARVLTGIQSTGVPHLGNLLGAIIPTIKMSKQDDNEVFSFIADMHSLTGIKDGVLIKENTYAVAATWLAFGIDIEKNVFYRQSDVPEVTELAWYLNCFMPFNRLQLAHSFKDKSDRTSEVNAGMYVPGVDGQKMSKSYGNTVNIFLPDKQLRKVIMKIKTDDKGLEDIKDPKTCTVFKLYALLASQEEIEKMALNYTSGNYGYGHAKQELFELIIVKFKKERKTFNELMENKNILDEKLAIGAKKARETAKITLNRIRTVLGY